MSVVFDEVTATVEPEAIPQTASEPPHGDEQQHSNVRDELEKLERRMARLRAD